MHFSVPHLSSLLVLGQLLLKYDVRSELALLSTFRRHQVTLLLWPPLCIFRRTKHLSVFCGNEFTKDHSTGYEIFQFK